MDIKLPISNKTKILLSLPGTVYDDKVGIIMGNQKISEAGLVSYRYRLYFPEPVNPGKSEFLGDLHDNDWFEEEWIEPIW